MQQGGNDRDIEILEKFMLLSGEEKQQIIEQLERRKEGAYGKCCRDQNGRTPRAHKQRT